MQLSPRVRDLTLSVTLALDARAKALAEQAEDDFLSVVSCAPQLAGYLARLG